MDTVGEKSSEEEDIPTAAHLYSSKRIFDEIIDVTNAEEIKSPVNNKENLSEKNKRAELTNQTVNHELYSSGRKLDTQYKLDGLSSHGHSSDQSLAIGSDPSDSEETDDDDIQGTNLKRPVDLYNPKEFEELNVSVEVKELFQNITRYTPQKMELSYKIAPYIPDFIPAVGDIDAFIKVTRPDGVNDRVGLIVLDEPCANQSEPAVLHLQLRSQSKSADIRQQVVIKRIEDAEKNQKYIEKWINDLNQLHASKHPPAVRLTNAMPDVDSLLQQWPTEVEDKLNENQLDLSKLDCDLRSLIDIVCNLVDIPVKAGSRLESLHVLFSLFLDVRNMKDYY